MTEAVGFKFDWDTILAHVPAPEAMPDAPLQMQVTMLDYNNFLGHVGIGRILAGNITKGQQVTLIPETNNEGGTRQAASGRPACATRGCIAYT